MIIEVVLTLACISTGMIFDFFESKLNQQFLYISVSVVLWVAYLSIGTEKFNSIHQLNKLS
jgi:hypothetical protein